MVASIVDPDLLYGQVAQIIPERMFFGSLKSTPKADPNVHYEPFYTDFGPLNLSVLYRFCEYIHSLLDTSKHKRKLFIYTSAEDTYRVNGAYIMGAYLIIYHQVPADTAYLRVKVAEPPEFIGFRDAAMGDPSYLLHLHDVLRGVEKALVLKWLNFDDFNPDEYEYYEKVENGDLNWIIPGKILSFCGPHNESKIIDGYPYHAPETYFDYFRENNVSTIVRLNIKLYDAERFKRAGFDHVDLFFIDGSTPSDELMLNFLDIVDKAKGAVAVHCKAGLGRTGTLIACWMMKEYGITAAESMAWLRICRPGSVIGPQQEYLVAKQKSLWSRSVAVHTAKKKRGDVSDPSALCSFKGLTSRVDDIRLSPKCSPRLTVTESPKVRPNILSVRRTKRSSGCEGTAADETALDEKGRTQGDRLLAIKARSQHSKTCPNTNIPAAYRNTDMPQTPPKVEKNGNTLFPQRTFSPMVARSSAACSLVSPRFSSPTTPIKQPSPAIPSPSSYRSHLVLRNQHAVPPPVSVVSKVTVAPALMVSPVRLTSGSKSTSSLRKTRGRTRVLPYPSQGTRVELTASPIGGYELRSRTSPLSSTLPVAAMALPPNSDALIGSRRKKRST